VQAEGDEPDAGKSGEEIFARRQLFMGKSLSIAYQRPLKIVRGWMQYLYDDTGRKYLDAVNNVPHVGHCHPRVVKATQRQAAILNTNTRYLHDIIIQYAERLSALMPDPLNVCFFVCSGSEANELAIRMARTYTARNDFVVVDGAYHGNSTTLIDLSSYKFDGPGGTGARPYVHKVIMPDIYRGPYKADYPDPGKAYAEHVHDAFGKAKNNNKAIAGFICESLLGCGGQIVLPDNYLREAFQYVRKAGAVCIADEVQVGFGRVGTHFWGFETQDVIPDIVTLGKPMGNGHPLAAVVTTREIADSFANGMEYFNTYGGNPVSCAVGMAVLDVIEEEGMQQHALEVGSYLKAGLVELKKKHQLIGDVRGLGLFIGIELVVDHKTLAPASEQASQVIEKMKDRGILISTDGPLENVLKIKPPLVFSRANADRFISVLDQILSEQL
jgi:4-aminobutyrate aminotransferase-like enzyme